MIQLKVDNRYSDNKIIKKKGALVGNKETMRITEIPNPANPSVPYLSVGLNLAKHLTAPK